jgi:hypothetical protein
MATGVNEELEEYRELVDMARAALWVWDSPDRRLKLTVALLKKTRELSLQDLAPQVFKVLTEACGRRDNISPSVILLFRDAVMDRAMERAQCLGLRFTWRRDLEDPEAVAEGLRKSIKEFVLGGEVDAEAATDLLKLLDRLASQDQDAKSTAELTRAVKAFADSIEEKKGRERLIKLEPARRN